MYMLSVCICVYANVNVYAKNIKYKIIYIVNIRLRNQI